MELHFRQADDAHPEDVPGTTGYGTIPIARSSLERHGGRVLRPGDAPMLADEQIASTVYRARSLLVPEDVQRDNNTVTVVREVLSGIGLDLVLPAPLGVGDGLDALVPYLSEVPRAVGLRPRDGAGPVVVDAWTALLTLRQAALSDGRLRDTVPRIALDHLLIGARTTNPNSPVIEGSPDPEDPRTAFGRVGYERMPVDLALPLPGRRRLPDLGHRRPVVAVLDTGVGANHLLGIADSGHTWQADAFLTVDEPIQDALGAAQRTGTPVGKAPDEAILDYWDRPVNAGPLIRDINSHQGHGTFIAGIVRQVVPDAQVRAIRVMHGDGVVYESVLVLALAVLGARLAAAQKLAATGCPVDPTDLVDVVNLSLGGYYETPYDKKWAPLINAVNALRRLGVIVVAAAGNHATARPFYPAALAVEPVPPDMVPLVSVGALNPNGSKAAFSNEGRWVNCWATGVALVSTMPNTLRGARTPAMRVRGQGNVPAARRESFDPDDYLAGVGLWSGTSFAASVAAAWIARELLRQSAGGLSLDDPSPAARHKRAWTALGKLPR